MYRALTLCVALAGLATAAEAKEENKVLIEVKGFVVPVSQVQVSPRVGGRGTPDRLRSFMPFLRPPRRVSGGLLARVGFDFTTKLCGSFGNSIYDEIMARVSTLIARGGDFRESAALRCARARVWKLPQTRGTHNRVTRRAGIAMKFGRG